MTDRDRLIEFVKDSLAKKPIFAILTIAIDVYGTRLQDRHRVGAMLKAR